jgi:prophage regulatory protein
MALAIDGSVSYNLWHMKRLEDAMSHWFSRFTELKERGIPWSRMHVDRLEKAGKFPKRVQLGESTVVWVEAEVDAFVAGRLAERETVAA